MKNMKNTTLTLMLLTLIITSESSAQVSTKYRRSSISMILMETPGLGENKELILNAYNNNPFPDKYNKHDVSVKNTSTESMTITDEDLILSGYLKDTLSTPMTIMKASLNPLKKLRYLNEDSTLATLEPSDKEMQKVYADKIINSNMIGKKVIGTWLNKKENFEVDQDLIIERGMYSASASDMADTMDAIMDPKDMFKDVELLGNTYTVINSMDFYKNEPVARIVRDLAKVEAMKKLVGKPQVLIDKSMAALDTIYEKTKEGYTVKCNSFLYKIKWNESTGDKVFNTFFNNSITDKKLAWDTASFMEMEFLGKTVSSSIVTFKIGEKRTLNEIIDLQVRRTLDNAMAKLQKEFVQFRPVSPILAIEPFSVQIGLKEGVEPKQKYEILEMDYTELGIPYWKVIGKVKTSKKLPIWDNRQGAEKQLDSEGNEVPPFTVFSGGKKAQPGLNYIRLIK